MYRYLVLILDNFVQSHELNISFFFCKAGLILETMEMFIPDRRRPAYVFRLGWSNRGWHGGTCNTPGKM